MKNLYLAMGILGLLTGLSACIDSSNSSNNHRPMPSDTHYFCGEFVVTKDSATFYDCATGISYPVARQDAYTVTVRKYLAQKPVSGQRVFIELEGTLDTLPPQPGKDAARTLFIETLIGLDPQVECQSSLLVTGLYEASGPDSVKTTLQLLPDYTFAMTRHDSDTVESTRRGSWGMSSATTLELNFPDREGFESHTRLRIDPQQEILMQGDENDRTDYRKVFL